MSNPSLFRPPPPPPSPPAARLDPLMALSKRTILPPVPTTKRAEPELLTDLTDDDMEMWALGGTRIMPKPTQPAHPASAAPAPATSPEPVIVPLSFPPVAISPSVAPSGVSANKSSALVWLLVAGLTGLFALGVVGVGVGLFMYRAHESEQSEPQTSAVAVSEATEQAPTQVQVTPPPPVPPPVRVEPAPVATSVATTESTAAKKLAVAAPPARGAGVLRTFAIGSGKPVYVDGRQVGVGGSSIKTACGRHSIGVGTGKAKTFDVPCNGTTITVGTPDGT